jgi:hypothetical protein
MRLQLGRHLDDIFTLIHFNLSLRIPLKRRGEIGVYGGGFSRFTCNKSLAVSQLSNPAAVITTYN